jgi:hypothetical protein
MPRSMLISLALAALLAPSSTVSADDLPCPVQKATWAVTTALPDPWSAEAEVGTLDSRVSAFINGREWIICRYAKDDDSPYRSVFEFLPSPGGGGGMYQVRISRPRFAYVVKIQCPVEQISVRLTTQVPSPWTSTTYVFHLAGSHTDNRMVCTYRTKEHDVWGAGPSAILRPVTPDAGPGLTTNPKPSPARPSRLTTEFAVTNAALGTEAAAVRAACPATVKFQGSVTANGKGTVRYRVVHNGSAGAPKEMDFPRASSRPVVFEFEVGNDTSGSMTARRKPAAPGSVTAAPVPPNRHTGWARIEILSPRGGVVRSDIASYDVTCTPRRPDRLKRQPAPRGGGE